MLLKDVGENEWLYKKSHRTQFGWIPKLNAWTGRLVNRATPGIALREFSEIYCNLRSKHFEQGCLILFVGCFIVVYPW